MFKGQPHEAAVLFAAGIGVFACDDMVISITNILTETVYLLPQNISGLFPGKSCQTAAEQTGIFFLDYVDQTGFLRNIRHDRLIASRQDHGLVFLYKDSFRRNFIQQAYFQILMRKIQIEDVLKGLDKLRYGHLDRGISVNKDQHGGKVHIIC